MLKQLNFSYFADRVKNRWVNNTLVGRYEVPPPHNVSLAKGLISIAATWDFVNFTIHSIIGKQFLEWVSPTSCPEETFFATLNFNPQIGSPGAFTGKRYILSDRHWPNFDKDDNINELIRGLDFKCRLYQSKLYLCNTFVNYVYITKYCDLMYHGNLPCSYPYTWVVT